MKFYGVNHFKSLAEAELLLALNSSSDIFMLLTVDILTTQSKLQTPLGSVHSS